MRKALIVGIDHYSKLDKLFGCVNDARAVKAILERHENGAVNFGCITLEGLDLFAPVKRNTLKDHIEKLFSDAVDIALFYFAGHGHIDASGGYLLPSNASRGDDGISLFEILKLANASPAKSKVIILDNCHSGIAGTPSEGQLATLAEGLTVLTASTEEQYASEDNKSGIFTTLLIEALKGGAANLIGQITPGSVYAYIDQSLGPWEQRPVFKTNIKEFISLRDVAPSISLNELQRLVEFFPRKDFEFSLDPSFEPELKGRDANMPPPDPNNTKIFAILQKYNRVNLLKPVDAPHMWHAAMQSKSCKLTPLGEHYRRLVQKGRL